MEKYIYSFTVAKSFKYKKLVSFRSFTVYSARFGNKNGERVKINLLLTLNFPIDRNVSGFFRLVLYTSFLYDRFKKIQVVLCVCECQFKAQNSVFLLEFAF